MNSNISERFVDGVTDVPQYSALMQSNGEKRTHPHARIGARARTHGLAVRNVFEVGSSLLSFERVWWGSFFSRVWCSGFVVRKKKKGEGEGNEVCWEGRICSSIPPSDRKGECPSISVEEGRGNTPEGAQSAAQSAEAAQSAATESSLGSPS